jgi:hypothetical protein
MTNNPDTSRSAQYTMYYWRRRQAITMLCIGNRRTQQSFDDVEYCLDRPDPMRPTADIKRTAISYIVLALQAMGGEV